MDIKTIMPMLVLGNNVSDKLKNAFMMEAFMKGSQARTMASIIQAQTAGNESRKAKKAEEESAVQGELVRALSQKQVFDSASLSAEEQTTFKNNSVVSNVAYSEALEAYKALPEAQRTAETFTTTFQTIAANKFQIQGMTDLAGKLKG